MYTGTCSGLLREVIDGYNGAIFAYGQSGGVCTLDSIIIVIVILLLMMLMMIRRSVLRVLS